MELFIGLAGVAVGATTAFLQAQTNKQKAEELEDANARRLAHFEVRLSTAIEAGRDIKNELSRISDRLNRLELQVSRVVGFLDKERAD